ncbi:MAG: 5'-nucleotidase [Planctomycetota bacterium]|nr:5'-nucleotidase [Planctomycetota bacterium]
MSHNQLRMSFLLACTVTVLSCGSAQDEQADHQAVEPQPPIAHEDLDATLWMQTSAEYHALAQQAYRLAQDNLAAALQDETWSADIDQQQLLTQPSTAQPLPPAVILDVDETVLDNSPFQARLIRQNAGYDVEAWHRWVEEAQATAVPGARAFIDFARAAGVTVFFVTNRESMVERATRRNLEQLELVHPDSDDTILSKHERDGWGTNKTTRRAFIARRYRVLLSIGDDLNDFVWVGFKPTAAARRQLAHEYRHMWGHKWIMLPNADYGGWERALFDWDDAAPASQKLEKKHSHLNTAPPENAAAPQ